ncbi:MAG: adenosine kinase [Bacteroidales bacterium]
MLIYKKTKVLGMGNALVDIIFQIGDDTHLQKLGLPKGSMSLVDDIQANNVLQYFKDYPRSIATGGSASNTISALASLNLSCGFIGCVGEKDEYGKFYTEDLNKHGVTPYFEKSDLPSGTAITLMSPDSERTFATFLGAACTLGAAHLKPEFFQGYDYFHVEGYLVQNYELIETAMRMAKAAGAKISCDMASYNVVEDNLDFLKRIVPEYVDILFVNEEEAKAFTGKEDLDALHIIGDMCDIAVVKVGARGSLLKQNGKVYIVKPCPATCIDTNGAGDSYAAGIIYGLSKHLNLDKCGEIASLISSKVVQVRGPKLGKETWHSLQEEINQIEKR